MEDDGKLPVTVAATTTTTVAAAPPFPGVRDVILWALLNAGHVVVSIVFTLVITSIGHAASDEVTDAEVADVVAGALVVGMLCCVVSQAAAGAVALALPRDRRRRLRLVLAYAALVATAAGHCIWAVLHGMFVAAEGGRLSFMTGVTTVAIFILGVGDLICFRVLIRRGGEEEEEEE